LDREGQMRGLRRRREHAGFKNLHRQKGGNHCVPASLA
jgi:hypothetical protein